MAERKVITGSIEQLIQDDKNFNQHTEYGMSLLEKSLRQHGAARGIVVDKNNRIIGGNGIVETATQIGLDKIVIVETTGDELVVTKRTDVDLDSKEGREMAIADNATASADLKWDAENIEAAKEEYEINPEDWGVHDWMMDSPDLDEDGVSSLFESAEGVANKKNPTITIEVPQSYDIDEVKDGLREYLAAFAGCVVR
ncbi:MAG: hypothetical protein KBS70_08545 [Bacteroidales bacterium]|nr:hypothetical protein [Candidatus Colicola equi]